MLFPAKPCHVFDGRIVKFWHTHCSYRIDDPDNDTNVYEVNV